MDRKQIEKVHKTPLSILLESVEQIQLFEFSLDAILLTVPNGVILRANPAACKIFGRTEEEIIREGRVGIVDISDPRLKLALNEREETGKFTGQLTGLRKDGKKFPMEVTSALFTDKNGNTLSSMIIRDISERIDAEVAIQKKLSQMEHFHKLTVGRELAMIKLKEEVNELLKKLGLPKKYL